MALVAPFMLRQTEPNGAGFRIAFQCCCEKTARCHTHVENNWLSPIDAEDIGYPMHLSSDLFHHVEKLLGCLLVSMIGGLTLLLKETVTLQIFSAL